VRTGLAVLVAWILLSVPFGIMVGRWLGRSGEEYPKAPYDPTLAELCSCPLALNAARILDDFEYACINQADGEDGLCSSCRAQCLRILEVARGRG
jgi:hypothetical protein